MAGKPAKGGLGRGLGSLLASTTAPEEQATAAATPGTRAPKAASTSSPAANNAAQNAPVSADTAQFAFIPLSSIKPNSRQPRQVFDPEALDELVHSIREIGLLQPIVVRPITNGRYELVAGERRLRATTIVGATEIAAIIRNTEDASMLRDALLENLHRANLNPLEEAAAYQQMLDDFGCTQEQLATQIGRSRPQVTNTLRLLRLPATVQKRVAAGVLSAGHARALLSLNDESRAEALAARIVAEGLSVRSVEEIVSAGAVKKPRAGTKKPSVNKGTHPDFVDAATTLEDILDTRVTIAYSSGPTGKKGSVTVEFADPADLHRIVKVISQ